MRVAIAYPPDPTQVRALPRNAVHDMIEALMASLDERDGDPDEESTGAEDDFVQGPYSDMRGPGCEVSDAGEMVGDEHDHNSSEDDFIAHAADGPGCAVADAGGSYGIDA